MKVKLSIPTLSVPKLSVPKLSMTDTSTSDKEPLYAEIPFLKRFTRRFSW